MKFKRNRPIYPEQILAGRVLAGLTMDQLAAESGTTRQTLWRYCHHGSGTVTYILEDIREALESHGVVLIDRTEKHGPGVAMAGNSARTAKR